MLRDYIVEELYDAIKREKVCDVILTYHWKEEFNQLFQFAYKPAFQYEHFNPVKYLVNITTLVTAAICKNRNHMITV